MIEQPDIFNDDQAYKKYLEIKDQTEREKKARVDKILDDYCYRQLNLPAAEYRSQWTDLIYRPQHYPVELVHPERVHYTSQFVGFNQQSNYQQRRQKAMNKVPQQIQYYYPPSNPFLQNAQQTLNQEQLLPSLSLQQGNLGYNQQLMTQSSPQIVYQNDPKSEFLRKCDNLQSRMDYNIRNVDKFYQYY
ncbi:unnamed protein product [Paramecium octaurelia]|uniref:Uncharacterized protein n=1 Tax=Paramecium octaurelia TaxID=43137 RepID=A0A8S1WVP7_PAROT|nr:unnamed protein product [Paramecium octaurelia]CAD8192901.1 unnamed protein product [Paramecium octaurelia]